MTEMNVYELGDLSCETNSTILLDQRITSAGTYTLNDSILNYNLIYICSDYVDALSNYHGKFFYIGKDANNILTDTNSYMMNYPNIDYSYYTAFNFTEDGNSLVVTKANSCYIHSIIGIK